MTPISASSLTRQTYRPDYKSVRQLAVDAATDDFLSPEPEPDPDDFLSPEPEPDPDEELPEPLDEADESDEADEPSDFAESEPEDELSDAAPLDPLAAPSLLAATVLDPFLLSVR
jgi:hypothetical protein